MKKKIILFTIAVLMLISLMGCAKTSKDAASDMEYIKNKGVLVVGVTSFAPMDYQDENGNWVGYDADLARGFAESIGVDVQFIEINWGNKIMELDGHTIDCVWNGMTLNKEVLSAMNCTEAYCDNAQVVILPAGEVDKYESPEDLKDLVFAVENGSAGNEVGEDNGYRCVPLQNQAAAIMEVASGNSQAAIVDLLIAEAMVGEDTSYPDLVIAFSLSEEKYGVGFRKDSDLTEACNEYLKKASEDGTVDSLREKYWGIKKSYKTFKDQFPIVMKALNKGFLQTLYLFAITLLGAIPLGFLIQFGERSRIKCISWFFKALIWIIRGTPLMIQLLIIYYFPGLALHNPIWGSGDAGRFWASAVAFIINYSCYFAVIFRGGLQSISSGQDEAGFVLGMSKTQIFFKIKLLQMVKNIIPPISNEVLTLVKDTSLARIIALPEIAWAGEAFLKTYAGISGIIWPVFFTAVYYLIFNGILSVVFGRIEKKLSYFE